MTEKFHNLSYSAVNDSVLESFVENVCLSGGARQIYGLNLECNPIKGQGLKALEKLPNLNSLNLSDTTISADSLVYLKGLPRLTYLILNKMELDNIDKAKAIIADMIVRNKYLDVRGVPITAEDIAAARNRVN